MSEPTKGRIVHFVGHGADPVHCAAMVVRVWGTGPDACVNLCVFRDGTNDRNIVMPPGHENDMVFWATSVVRSDEDQAKPYSWHFANECKSGV
ncbi:hypothetical protein IMX07_10860 [bacterium]|jgi:hypothetical protein|nr:hypothetical protein [bacterium]